MKIAIIAPNILNPYLGPSTVAHNILKGFIKINKDLEKRGIELTFVSLNGKKNDQILNNLKISAIKRYKLLSLIGEIEASINKPANDFDIVHAHSYISELFPWFNKIPTVFTPHGIYWEERKYQNIYGALWRLIAEQKFKLYYKRITKIVAISPYIVEEFSIRNYNMTNSIIIGNPVSDEFFEVKKSEENIIFYPATLVPRKNQLGFLIAISIIQEELKNYKIAFTASGNPEYISMLKKFVKKNNLNVEFIGKVSYEEMPELYSKASIVALTSFQETLPMSVLEAMASGTPVLASNIGGLKYLVKDSETGFLVDPSNPKDIAEKLLLLSHNKGLRKEMGMKAKKEAECFRSDNVAKRHLELYLNLMPEF